MSKSQKPPQLEAVYVMHFIGCSLGTKKQDLGMCQFNFFVESESHPLASHTTPPSLHSNPAGPNTLNQ